MAQAESLDAHERPPTLLRNVYKYYHKLSISALDSDPQILDFNHGPKPAIPADGNAVVECGIISKRTIAATCCNLADTFDLDQEVSSQDTSMYEVEDLPGLRLIPSLIPKKSQKDLMSKLLHRDLADPRHRTNVHLHHQLPYDATHGPESSPSDSIHGSSKSSFFNIFPRSSDLFLPVDSEAHKAFTVSQFLDHKLRWMTLGGQYDWTKKRYPLENPAFPADIAAFTHGLFPDMKAEAAIVNIYTPGDTLSMHRDVSESTNKGLVSISLGCEGIFVVGIDSHGDENPKYIVVRLHSGDAVFMSGPARYAWHGIPRIIPNTCPQWLRSWPAEDNAEKIDDVNDTRYESWRGWMSNKRINLNIRQMWN